MPNLVHGLWSGATGFLAGQVVDHFVQPQMNSDFSQVDLAAVKEARKQQKLSEKVAEGVGFACRKIIGPALTGASTFFIATGNTQSYPLAQVKQLAVIGVLIIALGNALQRSARKVMHSYISKQQKEKEAQAVKEALRQPRYVVMPTFITKEGYGYGETTSKAPAASKGWFGFLSSTPAKVKQS